MGSANGLLSRHRTLALLMTATGATLLAACGTPTPAAPTQVAPAQPAATSAPAPKPAAQSGPTPAPAAGEQPTMGGTLRVGAVGDVANNDPQSWGPRNGFGIFMAFDTLTTYDLELIPQPQLAESW